MAVEADAFEPATQPSGLILRRATAASEDLEIIARVDSAAFGSDSAGEREWLAPLCGIDEAEVAIAELHGAPVATGYAFRCDGDAGQTVYLGGIGVLPGARRRGIAAALSSWLLSHGFQEGARFGHLQTDSQGAARVYASLGFEEYNGIDIYRIA
jgi:GNAT superfamily N-acetyltransferase